MSEATAIVALVFLALGLLCALLVLSRQPGAANSAAAIHHGPAAPRVFSSAAGHSRECPTETIEHIFGSQDLDFIRCKSSQRLRRAFERDRRQIALHWVWGVFDETQQIMSHHFRSVRSSPDLSISLEAKLVAEFLLHQSLCLALAAALRLAGPDNLARLAAAVGNVRRQVGAAVESFPGAVPEDLTKSSGLQSNS
jgi:hypothetical protein